MFLKERYQTHCLTCQQRFEADTVGAAVKLVEEHEKLKHRDETRKPAASVVSLAIAQRS